MVWPARVFRKKGVLENRTQIKNADVIGHEYSTQNVTWVRSTKRTQIAARGKFGNGRNGVEGAVFGTQEWVRSESPPRKRCGGGWGRNGHVGWMVHCSLK